MMGLAKSSWVDRPKITGKNILTPELPLLVVGVKMEGKMKHVTFTCKIMT
jgi:hypothetical protein